MKTERDRDARRHFRRTSPDAPQGRVAITVAVAGMIALIVVTGLAIGLPSSGGDSSTVQSSDLTTLPGKKPQAGEVQVTTTIIRGSTSLFVTTTTPITTTTSTTTTTTTTLPVPKSKQLKVDPLSVTLDLDGSSSTITIRTGLSRTVGFFVTDVPAGIKLSSQTGKVTRDNPVRISLAVTERDRARSGTIRIVGSDGANVGVQIVVPGRGTGVPPVALAITSVRLDPEQVRCNASATLQATITGSPSSVRAFVTAGGSTLSLPMYRQSGSTWRVTLPGRGEGVRVSGSVMASDALGAASPVAFSYTVSGGQGC